MGDVETWPLAYRIERKTDDGWVFYASIHDEDGFKTWLTKIDNPKQYRLTKKEK